ncbi:MAG: hypothetical protein EKK55_25065 [Rhodocyclaceae bacterium]|nr:MAG: hypothetical protein EKK55_25065 [Rhodocyclaceae bacterium]
MGSNISQPRKVVPKTGFEIEIDGIGNVHAESCGVLEQELSLIMIHEGGARTVVQQSTNKYKTTPIEIKRPLDIADRKVAQWFAASKKGQDQRNGTFYYVANGERVAKRAIEQMNITKHSDGEGDAKADEDPQLEVFTVVPQELGDLEAM